MPVHGGAGGVINPLGFSFEEFDSLGQFRTTDNSIPVDSTGTNLYVADSNNNVIRQIVVATAAVTTLAGTAGMNGSLPLMPLAYSET